ncbi:MAG: hypothetical protein A2306_07160 [Omnitrophica WOR_2 bacterium RIFOXYB2_FULL_38_16]|nr:MAG: hypothetical protein A2243_06310 [Omnitrophica WOR_2 bacterium RIFOXYA2_FULL_38_17]OGX58992.1 MAG: hypothetical protein A2306_07160 [Omnitrophica WOR_2 bacterium RIFOXYB2_FULL_38_16]HBG61682.1 hypothetical protein [Candidatus Omnitrophota bacterium]
MYFMFTGTKLAIKPGIPPVTLPASCRLAKADIKKNTPIEKRLSPIAEALRYADVLNEASVDTMAEVGLRLNVSRARVSQMLNLLNLDERIREYLLSIEDPKKHNYFTERKLRKIAVIKDKKEQNLKFRKILEEIDIEI